MLIATVAAGTWSLWVRGRGDVVMLLLAPVGLAWGAALLGRYPYGGSRVMVFTAPALALVAAEGMQWSWRAAATSSRWPRAVVRSTLVAVVVATVGQTGWRVVVPWSRPDTAGAARFIRASRRPAEPVVSPQWEYRYYLRDLGPRFVFLEVGAGRHAQCEGYATSIDARLATFGLEGVTVCRLTRPDVERPGLTPRGDRR